MNKQIGFFKLNVTAGVLKLVQKIIFSFGFALNGIKTVFLTELNFKIHCLAIVIVVGLGLFFSIPVFHWLILFVCMSMVTAFEMINTSVEKLCDFIHPSQHKAIKSIKDMAAGAVLVAAVVAVACFLLIFIPVILQALP